jgi:hypothetical protein
VLLLSAWPSRTLTGKPLPDGFTKRLGDIARASGGTAEITACIDGPYGYVRSLDSFESVVLLAGASTDFLFLPLSLTCSSSWFLGGSGISYTAGLLSQIIRDCDAGKSTVKHVSFIWVVRSTGTSPITEP